jgi:dTDP-4-amino-4,6-dideoxygalactose transaminase
VWAADRQRARTVVRRVSSRIYLSPPEVDDDERASLLAALDSNWVAPAGPDLDAFEREIAARAGAPHAVALSSGTSALHLALVVLGVGPGDEVVGSTLTFAASANAVVYVGATPAFIDSDAATWNMDPGLLEDELADRGATGRLPKAVIAVDLYGQCADYDRIGEACRRYEVTLIEDAAEALGASYGGRPAGSLGDMAVLSFNGNKIITTSAGGMLLSDQHEWVDRARHLANQAREDVVHYEHRSVGYNYRLSNLLAALGRAQLRKLDSRLQHRRAVNEQYRSLLERLPGIDFMPEAPYGVPNRWLTCITIDADAFGATPEDVRLALERHNIESRPVWKPMHLQPVFATCAGRGGDVAAGIFRTGLCLPSGPALSTDDVARIAEIVAGVPASLSSPSVR